VFDLKAVNPNAVTRVDDRTPQEIIANIERQGRIVSEALGRLAKLMAEECDGTGRILEEKNIVLSIEQQRVYEWLNDDLNLPVFAAAYKGSIKLSHIRVHDHGD
jgi:hypothetical protein